MRKLFALASSLLLFGSMALAQGKDSPPAAPGATVGTAPTAASGDFSVTTKVGNFPGWAGAVDKLGAHQNGGKGCVGCHAPHSGAAGNGGNAANTYNSGTSSWAQVVDTTNAGNTALFGQDLGPLYSAPLTGQTNGVDVNNNPVTYTLPTVGEYTTRTAEVTGVMMCLSCHDGNIAKGAMMTNQAYEQKMGLLPANAYGPAAIPTLLGNDHTTAGNYGNDHPIGPDANLGAVGVAKQFQYSPLGCATKTMDCLTVKTTATDYQAFVNHYGAPSIISSGHSTPVVLPNTDPNKAYLVCTTCHTPHSMYTYKSNADAPIKADGGGTVYPTYFFINAPYNPGSNPGANQASSATQFCRQCHFTGAGGANEGSGIYGVTTAF